MSRMLRMVLLLLALGLGASTLVALTARADEGPAVQLANLMRAELEFVEGTEVIVSLVEAPPATTLPSHYHPGEEFIYVLEGSGTIRQKGKADVQLKSGDTFKVPFEQVHSAVSGEKGFKVLVFRVHRQGEPERIMAD